MPDTSSSPIDVSAVLEVRSERDRATKNKIVYQEIENDGPGLEYPAVSALYISKEALREVFGGYPQEVLITIEALS